MNPGQILLHLLQNRRVKPLHLTVGQLFLGHFQQFFKMVQAKAFATLCLFAKRLILDQVEVRRVVAVHIIVYLVA